MQWSEVTAPPKLKTLRQFAALSFCVFAGLAGLRLWRGHADGVAVALAIVAAIIGGIGTVRPAALRWLFTGWMVAAFPLGWTISRLSLAIVFYGVFTPVAVLFRLIGRDALRLRRKDMATYWTPKAAATRASDYLRQS